MNKVTYISIIITSLLFVSCTKKQESGLIDDSHKTAFALPEIPAVITSPDEKTKFLAIHYFNKFNFKDTTLIHLPDVAEQEIVNFIAILHQVPEQTKDSAFTKIFRSASVEPKMFSFFWNTLNRYLDDPNSPLRDESIYILLCQNMGKLPVVNEVISSNAAFNLQQALKNRTGMPAHNFEFTLASGKHKQLKEVKGKYTLLFFYEPDCETCIKTKALMRKSALLNHLMTESTLRIIAFFPEDDKQLWLKRLPECSPLWENGYDPSGYFTEKQPYNLRAFPTFYLLDNDKKVIMKDAPIEAIIEYLQQNG